MLRRTRWENALGRGYRFQHTDLFTVAGFCAPGFRTSPITYTTPVFGTVITSLPWIGIRLHYCASTISLPPRFPSPGLIWVNRGSVVRLSAGPEAYLVMRIVPPASGAKPFATL